MYCELVVIEVMYVSFSRVAQGLVFVRSGQGDQNMINVNDSSTLRGFCFSGSVVNRRKAARIGKGEEGEKSTVR